jgi:hypothetical protein
MIYDVVYSVAGKLDAYTGTIGPTLVTTRELVSGKELVLPYNAVVIHVQPKGP